MSFQHPSSHAQRTPNKPAVILEPSGQTLTYGELEIGSARGANVFRGLGLVPGDHVAIFLENHIQFFPVLWAAQRAGLIYTAIGSHLKAGEVSYIVNNCDAKVLITSAKLEAVAKTAARDFDRSVRKYSVDEGGELESWNSAIALSSVEPNGPECAGIHMLYSSGTTGQPKGVYPSWQPGRRIDHVVPGMAALRDYFGISSDTTYLSPAPLYHAAPLIFNQLVMFQGGTSVVMEKFDAELALKLIDKWEVTIAQFVPIMFVRMLKLDEKIRREHATNSLIKVIHAAAPCPIAVKQAMIDWWGPVIFEYYSSTENAGATLLDTNQWIDHPGSVGLPLGCAVHILDDRGNELPPGEIGDVYFENPNLNFEYYKEPEKTASTRNEMGWVTIGDVGYVDDDGFLYLADRKDFMIISGGVNIYPQELEDLLVAHPEVADAAVFGVPNEEFGEEVKAVVQPARKDFDPDALRIELLDWCRSQISTLKAPKSIDFDSNLPRLDNGKLYKNKIAQAYREASE
ncbi:MAG: acyl-CoA synthetase [Parvibaculaceae bacterium]